ncbi:hypothetical protein [Rhizobacter sp. Root1221]|uniref:hypothetical protein n=1 Tax=Rhizobacter sp. Root1221 TaxID=1736433 RepID=UPI0007138BE4|nr:hypothetical protein [Rhizobacter sp. Root1221]KQV85442.1 hypothetical protein ASC87_07050 [Rhizobacter sp. Root1221]
MTKRQNTEQTSALSPAPASLVDATPLAVVEVGAASEGAPAAPGTEIKVVAEQTSAPSPAPASVVDATPLAVVDVGAASEGAPAAPVTEIQVVKVEAFVLCDCLFGQASQLVELSEADAKAGAATGVLDLHPDAVAAAKAKL